MTVFRDITFLAAGPASERSRSRTKSEVAKGCFAAEGYMGWNLFTRPARLLRRSSRSAVSFWSTASRWTTRRLAVVDWRFSVSLAPLPLLWRTAFVSERRAVQSRRAPLRGAAQPQFEAMLATRLGHARRHFVLAVVVGRRAFLRQLFRGNRGTARSATLFVRGNHLAVSPNEGTKRVRGRM